MVENHFKVMFLTVVVLIFFGTASSQTKKILELDEAVSMAKSHSNLLKTDSLNLKIAESKLRQSKNSQLPQIMASANYTRISDNITPFTVSLPSGNVVLNPQILDQYNNSLQLKQLLWAGGKLSNINKINALENEAIGFESQKNKSDVSYSVTNLYYNLYAVNQSQKIIQANIELLKKQKKDAENFVKQGILLENETLKIDLAITNLESNLSDIQNNQILLKTNIGILTGLDQKTSFEIPETLPKTDSENLTYEQCLDKAIQNRPELKGLSIREKQANIVTKITKSNYLPTLSGIASLNYDQPNQRVFPNEAILTGTWFAGLSLNWNLSDLYTNKDKVKENKLSTAKLNTTINQAKEGIAMEVNADYINYLQAKQKIENATKAITQATENFRVEQNKFKANTTSATDFLNANTLLLQAKINLTTAISNAELAYKKLQKSIN
jgi:outer membrane protein